MPSAIEVRKVPIHSVADASELERLLDDEVMEADRVIAIIGKTEGNGGVNDYTRIIADRAFREALVAKGAPAEQVKQVPIVWSGGTDGVISPHATIFATLPPEKGFGHGEGKVALKEHLARRVPKELFDRPKMGFGVPLEHWLEGAQGLAGVTERLRAKHPKKELYAPIREEIFLEKMKRHGRDVDMSGMAWMVLFLEAWWQKHFV